MDIVLLTEILTDGIINKKELKRKKFQVKGVKPLRNRGLNNVEQCVKKRNMDKSTTLSEFAIKNSIKRHNEKFRQERLEKQVDALIRQKEIERKHPDLKQFLEEEDQKRKAKNNRIKAKLKRKGINIEKIFHTSY